MCIKTSSISEKAFANTYLMDGISLFAWTLWKALDIMSTSGSVQILPGTLSRISYYGSLIESSNRLLKATLLSYNISQLFFTPSKTFVAIKISPCPFSRSVYHISLKADRVTLAFTVLVKIRITKFRTKLIDFVCFKISVHHILLQYF